ncbi:hypothetical protein J6590_089744 [Homalodisca vitripennis]|nr:hypothetical protein J6590_089744 [Homalodisca vitripennis]
MPRQVSIPTAKWRVCNDEVEPISQCIVIEGMCTIIFIYFSHNCVAIFESVTDTGLTPAEFSSIREIHKRW